MEIDRKYTDQPSKKIHTGTEPLRNRCFRSTSNKLEGAILMKQCHYNKNPPFILLDQLMCCIIPLVHIVLTDTIS